MEITPQRFAAFLHQLDDNARAAEQTLNAADAKLGDGDTGSMCRRVMAAMAEAGAADAPTLSEAAKRAAAAAMKETGSSLGSLIATAAMTLAKKAKDLETDGRSVESADIPAVVASVRDAIAARGKSDVGDKTVVDSLDYIARKLAAGPIDLATARHATAAALEGLRQRPCRVGRARIFADRSIGIDDPGMLAVSLLLR